MTDYSKLSDQEKREVIKNAVKTYPDFPVSGVLFSDLFSVLQDPPIFALLKEQLVKSAREIEPPIDVAVGLDARGFLFGPIIALELQIPFVPIRKKGKLPGKVRSHKYALEYGEDTVEIQEGVIQPGQNVLIIDDLLATGGTMKAACDLVTVIGGKVAQCLVVIELVDLKGREKLPVPVISLMQS